MSKNVIDLTCEMYNSAPTMPMDPKLEISEHCNLNTLGYNLNRVTMSTHQGTHLDVPYHFFNDGDTLSELDINRCICYAVKLDLVNKGQGEPINISDLMPYEQVICDGSSILLHTGWDKVFPQQQFFVEQPYLTIELCRWLAKKKINLLGLDMPTVNPRDWKITHELLLGAGIIIVEGLCNMEQLPNEEFMFIGLPLKLHKCDGSPIRAVAVPLHQ